jgi:hypothetical protein
MESQSRTAILPGITHQDSIRAAHSPSAGRGCGLRQRVLQLCAGQSPVPEITFSGPIDNALPRTQATRCSTCGRRLWGLLARTPCIPQLT